MHPNCTQTGGTHLQVATVTRDTEPAGVTRPLRAGGGGVPDDSLFYRFILPPQAEGPCKCNGWKSQNPPPTPPRTDQPSNTVNLQEPCRSCSHTLGV